MDAQEQLVWDAEICAGVLGNGADFTLVFLDRPIDERALAEAKRKGFAYRGVVAVTKNGQAAAECGPNPDDFCTMLHAALAFAQQVADKLKAQRETSDDWLSFITKLYALEDPRG